MRILSMCDNEVMVTQIVRAYVEGNNLKLVDVQGDTMIFYDVGKLYAGNTVRQLYRDGFANLEQFWHWEWDFNVGDSDD